MIFKDKDFFMVWNLISNFVLKCHFIAFSRHIFSGKNGSPRLVGNKELSSIVCYLFACLLVLAAIHPGPEEEEEYLVLQKVPVHEEQRRQERGWIRPRT